MSYGRFLTWLSLLAAFAALALVGIGFYLFDKQRTESRGQVCGWFEGDHLDDVQGLVNTYAYFGGLTADDLRDSDFLAVFQQLPETEGEAVQDRAPDFCDEPGVALPEPDPCFPTRPPQVVRLSAEFGLPPQEPVPLQAECRRLPSTLRN